MKSKFIVIVVLTILNYSSLFSQQKNPTNEFHPSYNSFFKWKEFSFNQPWEKLKQICHLEKIVTYTDEYLNYYCGKISETKKSYILRNKIYHEYNGIVYDQAILCINIDNYIYGQGSLYFIKQTKDSVEAKQLYNEILKTLYNKYGNYTYQQTGYNREFFDSINLNKKNTYFKDENGKEAFTIGTIGQLLNKDNPFSVVQETLWNKMNIYLRVYFIKERNLIILYNQDVRSLAERPFDGNNLRSLFRDSEYDERYTDIFKEFDKKNGYKELKFGMPRSSVIKIVKLKDADILKQYLVKNIEYNNWFYIPFDECNLSFNKKNKLYEVALIKDAFSNDEYDNFLKELVSMFGSPKKFKEKSDKFGSTFWQGKNLNVFIQRPNDGSLYVTFHSSEFNDYSPSDKLY